jgi:intracellular septation protein A
MRVTNALLIQIKYSRAYVDVEYLKRILIVTALPIALTCVRMILSKQPQEHVAVEQWMPMGIMMVFLIVTIIVPASRMLTKRIPMVTGLAMPVIIVRLFTIRTKKIRMEMELEMPVTTARILLMAILRSRVFA